MCSRRECSSNYLLIHYRLIFVLQFSLGLAWIGTLLETIACACVPNIDFHSSIRANIWLKVSFGLHYDKQKSSLLENLLLRRFICARDGFQLNKKFCFWAQWQRKTGFIWGGGRTERQNDHSHAQCVRNDWRIQCCYSSLFVLGTEIGIWLQDLVLASLL